MSKPRTALPRVALLALALASLTCSDDASDFGTGRLSGTVYLAEPVEGAVVTVSRWDEGVVGAEVCRATSDAAGAWECASGKYFGVMLVTATGGHTVEQGAALTLPAGAVLRAPLIDLEPQQQRAIHLNPASDLIVALGAARAAAGQDADFKAAVAHAHALIRAHLDADPVTVAPKSVDATTAFDEPARVALVLRGLGEYAHTAAVDQAVTVQAINTRALLDQLVKDASSAEARLDGNGAEVLSVGPACQLPSNCTAEGPGCYASCSVHTSSLRGRLANAAITWLGTPANRTGLGPDDVLTWATALTTNTDAELFGPEPPEDNDTLGPVITWATPAAGQVFTTGTIMLDVTAADPLGVATLGVDHVVGQTRTPIADTDPTPERFVGSLPLTPALAEGTLTLEAHATDRDTNPSSDTREVSINQLTGGAISGVAIKAALASAPVTVRTFTNAAPGPILASGTTDPAGNFINLAIPEGTSGDLLLEVGGAGSYAEDAQPATVVSLAATEKLSVVLPAYVDGDTLAGLVVSPATTLAVAYTTYLQGANQGGADLAAKWATAVAALERHTGVTGLTAVVPSVPSQIDTLDDADRYGLLLLALSRTAWQASALGGGDAGAFGSAINAMKVLQVWVRDLGDGCWDGKAGPTALSYGGPTLLTDEATRLDLAQALVAYLASPQNQTQFAAPADVLPLLDTWATGGGNTGPGSCAGTNHTFDDAGASFDREGPVITWGTFPATDPFVRGMVTVTATAVDNLPTLPSLVFTTGQTDIDVAANAVRAVLDTTGLNGPVPLAVRATDGSTNATTAMHDLIADNLAPAITLTAPAMDGLFLRPPVTLGWTVVEANPMATTATLDTTTPVTPGFQVAAEGAHSVVVTATDRAGGSSTATRTFTIDSTAPVLNVTAPASGSYVRGPVTVSWTVGDANPGTTASATLNGTPITSPHTFNGEASYALVVNATDAAGNTAATVTRTFTIDNTPPVITISGIVDGGAYPSGVQIFYSATDANPGTTIAATANGAPHNSGQSLFTAAGYTLVVTATDAAGNPATASRRFLVDSISPTVTIRTQTPVGSYVKTPLTIVVDGADNLQTSGVAGLAGSLAAPVSLTVTALSNGTPTTPTGGEVVNGDGSRTRTATFAGVADGPLAATFAMTDRSGNVAMQRSVNVTVDNTAPTGLVVASTGFVSTTGTFWTTQALPTLTGSITEAYPGAVVTLLNGAAVVGSGTVAGGAWTATFTTSVPVSTGFDVTVRVTDAAGNFVDAPVQRVARDITGPQITSVIKQVANEATDTVTYPTPGAGFAHHVHSPATVDLGEAGAGAPTVCRDVPKYAYLTATAPQATQNGDNSLLFKWSVTDQSAAATLGGAGVDDMTFEWVATHATSGVATPLYPITGTAAGAGTWNVDVPLHRDGTQPVPALGVVGQLREGRFDIELRAKDKLGNATTLVRCMNYQPIGVPVEALNPVSATGTNALASESLTGNSPISALLNATEAGAGMMALTVRNPTADPVVLTLTPAGSTGTYSENWSFLRVPSASAVNTTVSCGDNINGRITTGACSQGLSGAPPAPSEVTTGAPLTTQLVVRAWYGVGTPVTITQPTPSTFQFTAAANTTYAVHVGLRDLSSARYMGTAGNVEATTQYWHYDAVNQIGTYRTMSYTGLSTIVPFSSGGNGVDVACVDMQTAEIPVGSGTIYYTCKQTRRFGAIRYLTSVGVQFLELLVQAQSLAGATTTYSHAGFTFLPRIGTYSWTPMETPQ